MNIIEQINLDFLQSRKSKNTEITLLLSTLKGEIERRPNKSINDEDIIPIIKKMVDNLILTDTEQSKKESEYLSKYLPILLNEEEIETIVTFLISQHGKTFPVLMKKFQEHYKGKADNKLVSQIINKLIL